MAPPCLVPWLQPPGCAAGWTLAQPQRVLPMAPLAPVAPWLSSEHGAERELQQPELLETHPQKIYHRGLIGADSPRASAKLQPFAAGLQAPERRRPGMRAAARSRQHFLGCAQDSPSKSQHPTQRQSHRQGVPFGASWMLSADHLAHLSPWRGGDRSWRERVLQCCYRRHKCSLSPGNAGNTREIVEESPSLRGHPFFSLRKTPHGSLDQSPQIPGHGEQRWPS